MTLIKEVVGQPESVCVQKFKPAIFHMDQSCKTVLVTMTLVQMTIMCALCTVHSVRSVQGHTSYLSFLLHRQDFWSQSFTPKSA